MDERLKEIGCDYAIIDVKKHRRVLLIDGDCNEQGIGMGYYQDDVGWLCAKWDMYTDEWREVKVNPTHYLVMEGPI